MFVCIRFLLGFSIVAIVGLSLGVGFGVSGYVGFPLTQVSFMAIFILFGIGIDDMFLIVDSVDRHAGAGEFMACLRCACQPSEPHTFYFHTIIISTFCIRRHHLHVFYYIWDHVLGI